MESRDKPAAPYCQLKDINGPRDLVYSILSHALDYKPQDGDTAFTGGIEFRYDAKTNTWKEVGK